MKASDWLIAKMYMLFLPCISHLYHEYDFLTSVYSFFTLARILAQ